MATTVRLPFLALVGAVLLLAGCTAQPGSIPTQPTTTISPTSPTVKPSSTAESPDPQSTPVTISCAKLVDDQTIYDWGSGNWAVDPAFSPAAGSSAEKIVAFDGVACGWVNLTSNEKLTVAVANLSADSLAAVKSDLATSSDPVSTYGADGYFTVTGGVGQADAFAGRYWIIASSSALFESGDAEPIIRAAMDALG
jgi:hypothetical protein